VLAAAASFVATLVFVLIWLRVGGRSLGRLIGSSSWLAVPNERSFHASPKLTSGGVAIVIPILGVMAVNAWHGVVWAGWLALACGVIALLGLLDDGLNLPARWRLPVQGICVGVVLFFAGGVADGIADGSGDDSVGVSGGLLVFFSGLGLLWFLNLYNFMDGIDGLAASQACCYSLAIALYPVGDFGWLVGLAWSVFASNLAFLAFNWAPSRLFMGDVGSAFLGLLLGVLALTFAQVQAVPLVASLVLLSGFWFDATYTLCVRILTGQRFTEGHRSHLYQKLAARFGHGRTTLGYVLFNLLWLWPLAYLSAAAATPLAPWNGVPWCILACAPLAVGCWRLKAGEPGADTVNELPGQAGSDRNSDRK